MRIFCVFVVLYLIQMCNVEGQSNNTTEENGGTNGNEESSGSNKAIARLTNVRNGHDEFYFVAVQNDSSPSGWAIDIKKHVSAPALQYIQQVFMFARKPGQPQFKQYYSSYLCNLISTDPEDTDDPVDNFLPRQIFRMIFYGVDDCYNLDEGIIPIQSTAYVNADGDDKNSKNVEFPLTSPFKLMVSIIDNDDEDNPDTDYIFQANFTVGDFDESEGENGKPEYKCFDTQWNYWILWRICLAFEYVDTMLQL